MTCEKRQVSLLCLWRIVANVFPIVFSQTRQRRRSCEASRHFKETWNLSRLSLSLRWCCGMSAHIERELCCVHVIKVGEQLKIARKLRAKQLISAKDFHSIFVQRPTAAGVVVNFSSHSQKSLVVYIVLYWGLYRGGLIIHRELIQVVKWMFIVICT